MVRQSFSRRVMFPIAVVMSIMVISINAYDLSRSIENRTAHALIVQLSAILMFLSIWLGALFANTIAFFRGASFSERLIVCLATPIIWCAKTLYHFVGIYSTGEFFFLFLHHYIIGCPVVAILCMGLSEIWCRKIYRRKSGDSIKIFTLNNTIVLIMGLLLTTFFLWNGGHNYYYLYMDMYSYIFL
jgi:hypothetical protein